MTKTFEEFCKECQKMKSLNIQLKIIISMFIIFLGTLGWLLVENIEMSKSVVSIETTLKVSIPDMQNRISSIEEHIQTCVYCNMRRVLSRKPSTVNTK